MCGCPDYRYKCTCPSINPSIPACIQLSDAADVLVPNPGSGTVRFNLTPYCRNI